jgi:hypothetical protein
VSATPRARLRWSYQVHLADAGKDICHQDLASQVLVQINRFSRRRLPNFHTESQGEVRRENAENRGSYISKSTRARLHESQAD